MGQLEIVKVKDTDGFAVIENRIGQKPKFKYYGSHENCVAYKDMIDHVNNEMDKIDGIING